MTRNQNYLQETSGPYRTDHPPNELHLMMRLHPGAEIIISWELDCSPQVMTVATTSSEPSKSKDFDNDQPGPTFSRTV
jgi:hypothetical protein